MSIAKNVKGHCNVRASGLAGWSSPRLFVPYGQISLGRRANSREVTRWASRQKALNLWPLARKREGRDGSSWWQCGITEMTKCDWGNEKAKDLAQKIAKAKNQVRKKEISRIEDLLVSMRHRLASQQRASKRKPPKSRMTFGFFQRLRWEQGLKTVDGCNRELVGEFCSIMA